MRRRALPLAALAMAGSGAGEVVVPCPGPPCLRVGGTAPRSGWAASQGVAAARGAEVWARAVNADCSEAGCGLQVGAQRMPVELTLYDDASNRTRTAELYQQLVVDDSVDQLLGPYGTSFSAIASGVAAAHGRVIFLGNAAGDSAYPEAPLSGQAPTHAFGVVTTAASYVTTTAQMLHMYHGARTAGVLWRSDNPFPADTASGALEAFDISLDGTPTLTVSESREFAGGETASEAAIEAQMAAVCVPGVDTLWLFGLRGDATALLLALARLRQGSGGAGCRPKSCGAMPSSPRAAASDQSGRCAKGVHQLDFRSVGDGNEQHRPLW